MSLRPRAAPPPSAPSAPGARLQRVLRIGRATAAIPMGAQRELQAELLTAIVNNNLAGVNALIASNVDVNALLIPETGGEARLFRSGVAPLILASLMGHHEIVSALGAAGADPNAVFQGSTALDVAVERQLPRVVKALLDEPFEDTIDQLVKMDAQGYTPLHKAVQKSNLEIAEILIDHDDVGEQFGAPRITDRLSRALGTPMSMAVVAGNTSMVKLFLDNGASPFRRDHNNRTPLELARRRGYHRIAEMLLTAINERRGAAAREQAAREEGSPPGSPPRTPPPRPRPAEPPRLPDRYRIPDAAPAAARQ